MNYNSKNNLFENNNLEILNNNHSMLISKKIDTYFNDLIKTPEPIQVSGGKSEFSFSKFYYEYVEHNLLLLFIILCLVIFLIIKYINKNYPDEEVNFAKNTNYKNKPNTNNNDNTGTDTYTDTDTNTDTDTDTDTNTDDTFEKEKIKKELKRQKLKEIKRETDRKKHLLELEKQSILDIIDEISNMNNEKIKNNIRTINQNTNNKVRHTQNYNRTHDISHNNNYINEEYIIGPAESRSGSFFDENQANYSDYSLITSNDMYDNGSYYNINKNMNYKNKKNPNYVKGIYIESPYDE